MADNQEQDHSYFYTKLTEEDRNKADAIIGFLSGMNLAAAKKLLTAVEEELPHLSSIGS